MTPVGDRSGPKTTVDSSSLAEAISTLKLGQALTAVQLSAQTVLIREALLMKRALEYYANQENWLDDVPMKTDPEDGLLTLPDNGKVALWALHRLDLQLGAAFSSPEEVAVVAPVAVELDPAVIDAEPVVIPKIEEVN